MRLGDLSCLTNQLKTLGFSGSLNTTFVERITLTLRHALAALSRRCWTTAQLTGELLTHLEWWRAYPQGAFGSYHFCRPHLSLRLKSKVPLARWGQHAPRRYAPHTPAMAAGLTDHIWSVQELLAFPSARDLADGRRGWPPAEITKANAGSRHKFARDAVISSTDGLKRPPPHLIQNYLTSKLAVPFLAPG
jgi:hypothetical protein